MSILILKRPSKSGDTSVLSLSIVNLSKLIPSVLMMSCLGLSQSAFAEKGFDLTPLKRQQDALNRALTGFGVTADGERSLGSTSQSRDDAGPPPLFKRHGDLSGLRIPQGKFLFGHLVNRLVVGGEGSPSIIEIDANQGALSGLRMMGIARQSSTTARLSIEIQRLLFRTGKATALQATAMDESGAYGLNAQVVSQKALAIIGAMGSSFISGMAASQQTMSTNAFGFQNSRPTGRNAVLQGLAQTAADQSKRLIDEATAEKPVMIVEANTPVTVLVQEEVHY